MHVKGYEIYVHVCLLVKSLIFVASKEKNSEENHVPS